MRLFIFFATSTVGGTHTSDIAGWLGFNCETVCGLLLGDDVSRFVLFFNRIPPVPWFFVWIDKKYVWVPLYLRAGSCFFMALRDRDFLSMRPPGICEGGCVKRTHVFRRKY